MKENRVVLTGGHAGATAYAFIEELRKSKKGWDIYWIGAARALEGKALPTLEKAVFPKIGVKFVPIVAGKIQRRFTLYTIPSLFKIPIGFIHALILLLRIKPKIIVSFGGFASFPVVVMGFLLGIPSIVHEQTVAYGLANKYSAFFATKVALARKESSKYFKKGKGVVTGNPISKEILSLPKKFKVSEPGTVLITGGSRGSEVINESVLKILPKLLSRYRVIHQTGMNQLAMINKFKEGLPQALKENYEVYGMVEPWNWFKLISRADVIVSRAGANIVSEIIAAGRPSLLIPIPWSFMDEQNANAKFAQDFGIARILPQEKLSPETLLTQIEDIFKDWEGIIEKVKGKESPDKEASRRLVELVEGSLK
jgi:UDP-N-acetylglucosamine--N-acetylmuramyl-(pentapeptide) pyrophosphoryl-undecaprenol N-acetylglucosamine transferase